MFRNKGDRGVKKLSDPFGLENIDIYANEGILNVRVPDGKKQLFSKKKIQKVTKFHCGIHPGCPGFVIPNRAT